MKRYALFSAISLCVLTSAPSSFAEVSTANAARALGNAFAETYEKVLPCVVVLDVVKNEDANNPPPLFGPMRQDERPRKKRQRVEESEGSGFIIREDGYILTNAHVIQGADPVHGVVARLKDGRRLPVRIVGLDDKTDLAVLKADAQGLPAIEWGDSDAARVGEFVCGIGAPFELDFTLTAGVISAKGRSNLTSTVYEDYIQTDAAINPGNSGGPLCDLDGKIIGVNTLINGINRGLGFAIPSKLARSVSESIIAQGRVQRPWLGIRIESLNEHPPLQQMMGLENGVLVRTIEPDAPASRSNLQPADVIVEVDGESVKTAKDLQQTILKKSIGQAVQLKVWRREGRKSGYRTVDVTTEELPQSPIISARNTKREPEFMMPPEEQGTDVEDLGTMGMQIQDLPKDIADQLGLSVSGVVVTRVMAGSPAALAGLQPKDIITAVGANVISDTATFLAALEQMDETSGAVLLVERSGKKTYAILKP